MEDLRQTNRMLVVLALILAAIAVLLGGLYANMRRIQGDVAKIAVSVDEKGGASAMEHK